MQWQMNQKLKFNSDNFIKKIRMQKVLQKCITFFPRRVKSDLFQALPRLDGFEITSIAPLMYKCLFYLPLLFFIPSSSVHQPYSLLLLQRRRITAPFLTQYLLVLSRQGVNWAKPRQNKSFFCPSGEKSCLFQCLCRRLDPFENNSDSDDVIAYCE